MHVASFGGHETEATIANLLRLAKRGLIRTIKDVIEIDENSKIVDGDTHYIINYGKFGLSGTETKFLVVQKSQIVDIAIFLDEGKIKELEGGK